MTGLEIFLLVGICILTILFVISFVAYIEVKRNFDCWQHSVQRTYDKVDQLVMEKNELRKDVDFYVNEIETMISRYEHRKGE